MKLNVYFYKKILLKKFDNTKNLVKNFYEFSSTFAWNGRLKYKLYQIVLKYTDVSNRIVIEYSKLNIFI